MLRVINGTHNIAYMEVRDRPPPHPRTHTHTHTHFADCQNVGRRIIFACVQPRATGHGWGPLER